ncbi:hypothetical protein CTI14_68495, partial [Methylobacterium radiotolerans]
NSASSPPCVTGDSEREETTAWLAQGAPKRAARPTTTRTTNSVGVRVEFGKFTALRHRRQ